MSVVQNGLFSLCTSLRTEGQLRRTLKNFDKEKTKSPTGWKIQLAFGFAILILLIVGASSNRSMVVSNESALRVRHTHQVLGNLQNLLLAMETFESSYRGFVLTGDESDLKSYRANILSSEQHEAAVRSLTVDNPAQQGRLPALETLISQKIQFGEMVVDLRRTKGFEAAADAIRSGQGNRSMDDIDRIIHELQEEERRLLTLRDADANRHLSQTKMILILGTTLGLLIAFAAAWSVHRDNSRRGVAEEALLESEQGAAVILDLTHDAIFVRNPKNEIVFWNKGAEALYGWSKNEVSGRTTHDLLNTVFHAPLAEIEAEVFRTGCWEGELTHQRRDGTSLIVLSRWAVQKDGSGNPVATLESNRDITQHKTAEAHLIRMEARYRGLLEAAPDAIVIVNQSAEIVLVNAQTEKLFGYRRDELLNKAIEILIPRRFLNEHPGHRNEFLGHPQVRAMGQGMDLFGLRKDGSEFPAEIMLSPSGIADGILITAAIRDITARKRAEEHLVKAADELKRSNIELQQFGYVASHDLQEPLRMVASYTQLLAKRYKGRLDSDADEFIDYAVDGCSRMQRLLQDLLAYSRSGTDVTAPREVSCETALKEALANLRVTIAESGAVVTHDPLPAIVSDDSQLVLVFQNLVGNAIKYRGAEAPRVHVSATKNGRNAWTFSVRDNGMGIDARYFERIFVLFQRLHGRNEFKGTGIGLAICKKIVERLGGRIWVESQPQKGSTFCFSLPESGGV